MEKKNISVYCLTHNKHFSRKKFFARILIIVQVENVWED